MTKKLKIGKFAKARHASDDREADITCDDVVVGLVEARKTNAGSILVERWVITEYYVELWDAGCNVTDSQTFPVRSDGTAGAKRRVRRWLSPRPGESRAEVPT